MNMLGCLDQPTSGEYYLDEELVNAMSRDDYAKIRNEKIGFVFQGFNLLARTSIVENVELPLLYDHTGRIPDSQVAAIDALKRVGLGDRLDHEPSQLSGGQQQRVAIARALVNKPAMILADEPTGNLDSRTSIDVMALFQELNEQGITIILVTHEPDIALYAKRIVEVKDGLIVRDIQIQDRKNAAADLEELNRTAVPGVVEVLEHAAGKPLM
jgi:putative ABC transport system ATP-binding protein